MRDCYGTRRVEIGINGERLVARFTYLPPDLAAGMMNDQIENVKLNKLSGEPIYDIKIERDLNFWDVVCAQIVAMRDHWRR